MLRMLGRPCAHARACASACLHTGRLDCVTQASWQLFATAHALVVGCCIIRSIGMTQFDVRDDDDDDGKSHPECKYANKRGHAHAATAHGLTYLAGLM